MAEKPFRVTCTDCNATFYKRVSVAPKACINCGGANYNKVTEQIPLMDTKSPDGSVWMVFVENDGTLSTAKVVE